MKWSEHMIARALALQIFQRKNLVVVNNCNWTGHECDLLIVTHDLRIIDVEVKISRADFKADAKKDKWWHRFGGTYVDGKYVEVSPTPRDWPPKVWKHYYALPASIWKPEMLECINPNSGVLLLRKGKGSGHLVVDVERRVRSNKDAKNITAAQAVDIARLASLRMWDAYKNMEAARDELRRMRELTQPSRDAAATHHPEEVME